jgi:hypothetical protein
VTSREAIEIGAPIAAQLGLIQLALRERGSVGWLIFDHRQRNAVAMRLLGLGDVLEHRFFYWIPAEGMPAAIVHRHDDAVLPELPGERLLYASSIELRSLLERNLPREGVLCLEQAPYEHHADVAMVDASTAELVRGKHVELRSSSELANRFAGPLSEHELGGVRETCAQLIPLGRALEALSAKRMPTREEIEQALASSLAAPADARFAMGRQMEAGRLALDRTVDADAASLRLDVAVHSAHGIAIPATYMLRIARSAAQKSFDEDLREVALTALSLPRVHRLLGSNLGEATHAAAKKRGITLSTPCVGWPLGHVLRSTHACTFDADGFVDARPLVIGTCWSLQASGSREGVYGSISALAVLTERGFDVLWETPAGCAGMSPRE